ncbi:LysR family transcriptional regulator [Leisingera sp.]|uniref:LysR family transcriptional regulator n=1 Tax=Leisingera sp. TaxID=1879318 RepID=UPI003A5BF085
MEKIAPQTSQPHSLADVDLRLLRVFAEIVNANGFSAAQVNLGMTQATISAHMRHLEERLGMRLCERGRGGFYLTEEGRQIYSAMLDLFGSIDRFQNAVSEAQGELSGDLSFGTVDAMHTNRSLRLDRAIEEFAKLAPQVRLSIDIAAPQVLSQGILNGRYQAVLMPSQRQLGQMQAVDVFEERQNLYCSCRHPLFSVEEDTLTDAVLARQDFAGRTYMPQGPICGIGFNWHAVAAHMESTLLLILSGAFIGFLPDHYAGPEVQRGRLRTLAKDRVTFNDTFQIVYPRKRPSRAASLLAKAILSCQADS